MQADKGATGIERMSIEVAYEWLKEHNRKLVERILKGKYSPKSVRRVEVPQQGGGVRKLDIPMVVDRIIQQAWHINSHFNIADWKRSIAGFATESGGLSGNNGKSQEQSTKT